MQKHREVREVHLRAQFLANPTKANRVAVVVRENDVDVVHILELDKQEQEAWHRNDPVVSGRLIGTYPQVVKIQTGSIAELAAIEMKRFDENHKPLNS